MLTVFRKFRNSLLASLPVSPVTGGHSLWRRLAGRYMLYAFGEIFLVVIGILIALQVNNWNESYKNSMLEAKIVENIKGDLLQDKVNLTEVINQADSKLALFDIMLEDMSTLYQINPIRLDSLFIAAYDPIPTFFPIIGAFKSESSSGNMGMFQDKLYVSALYKLYTDYDRLSGNAEDLDNTWDIRYEKYRHARRTGSLGKLTDTEISDVLDDLSRSSKHLRFYRNRCTFVYKEIEKVLALK